MSHNFSLLLPFLLLLLVPSTLSSLLQVISVFRHGARQPLYNFYNAATFPDQGQLTPVGMRQHFLLGKELRKEYVHKLGFLSKQYNSKEIVVRSTSVNRTVVSALSQLSGLYPMGTGPRISKNVKKDLTLPPFEGVKGILLYLHKCHMKKLTII
jgi:Histidine phosphatase superfamily (branch 2)